MITVEFIGLSKNKSLRKAISFWYKNLFKNMTLKEFISHCTIKKEGIEYIIIYRN